MLPLWPDSPVPLSYQLEQALKHQLDQGRCKPAAAAPGRRHAADTRPLSQPLPTTYNLPPLRSIDTLESLAADRATAHQQQVAPGTPQIGVERVADTYNDLPL